MQPTLRQLQAFSHIYQLGSLTRAGRAMHLTQSALSLLLQQLEDILGVALFERSSRSLRPTAAAHELFEATTRVLSDVERLMGQARGLVDRRLGVLQFGVATAVAATVMPEAIARFELRHPEVRLVMHDMGPEQLVLPVQTAKVEFSIGTSRTLADDVDFAPLLTDSLAIICRSDNPMAGLERATWSDLRDVPVISVRHGNAIRGLIDEAVSQAGVAFEPKWEVSYFATALAMTVRGLGVSVLPGYLVGASPYPGLVTRRLHDPAVERSLYVITRAGAGLSPAALAMIQIMREITTVP